jgi:hypothetical protein
MVPPHYGMVHHGIKIEGIDRTGHIFKENFLSECAILRPLAPNGVAI